MGEICAMSQALKARPSEIIFLEDAFEAFCLDEAATVYLQYIRMGRRLAHRETADNTELIAQLTGGNTVVSGMKR